MSARSEAEQSRKPRWVKDKTRIVRGGCFLGRSGMLCKPPPLRLTGSRAVSCTYVALELRPGGSSKGLVPVRTSILEEAWWGIPAAALHHQISPALAGSSVSPFVWSQGTPSEDKLPWKRSSKLCKYAHLQTSCTCDKCTPPPPPLFFFLPLFFLVSLFFFKFKHLKAQPCCSAFYTKRRNFLAYVIVSWVLLI